jgi:hypothetical protein
MCEHWDVCIHTCACVVQSRGCVVCVFKHDGLLLRRMGLNSLTLGDPQPSLLEVQLGSQPGTVPYLEPGSMASGSFLPDAGSVSGSRSSSWGTESPVPKPPPITLSASPSEGVSLSQPGAGP